MDTDTLLAILSSLIHPLELEHSVLLDALVHSQGNVEAAARTIRSGPPRKKRKTSAKVGLDGWLKGGGKDQEAATSNERSPGTTKAPSIEDTDITDEASTSRSVVRERQHVATTSISTKKPPSTVKPVSQTEFMALLRPPNSSDSTPKSQLPKQPPLTLVSPEHVAQHTPCTLHNSVLPPELACRCVQIRRLRLGCSCSICRLFYTMLHASRDWKRNKWWLFDRVVESPHRTSFFVRRDIDPEQAHDMKEAAQYWCVSGSKGAL